MIEPNTLDRIAFLLGATPGARSALAAGGVLRRLPQGAVLWTQGSRPRGLFVILEGRVRVLRGAGGRQHVVHVEGPGGTLGEVPLFGGGAYPATAIAAEPTLCVIFTRETLAAAIAADPGFAWVFLERLANRVRHLVDRLDRLAAQDVTSRLATYLLDRSAAAGSHQFTLNATQAVIAEELGTVREVVVRAFRRLRESGVIRTTRGVVEVLDVEMLREVASG